MLQSMGSQRFGRNSVTELIDTKYAFIGALQFTKPLLLPNYTHI